MLSATHLCISFIIIILIWLCISYCSLIIRRKKALEAFLVVEKLLKQRYDLISGILMIAQKLMDSQKVLLDEMNALKELSIKLSSDFSNIDRKIALNNEITKKMNKFFVDVKNSDLLNSDSTMLNVIQTYRDLRLHICKESKFFNSAAKDLKKSVEIFPSSFIARLCNIKTVDFFEEEEIDNEL